MECGSDSDGSHISATPPRESKPSEASLQALLSSYKSRSKNKSRVSSSISHLQPTLIRRTPKTKTKTKTKTRTETSEDTVQPDPSVSSTFSNQYEFSVPIRRVFSGNSDVSLSIPMENVPANYFSKKLHFSKMRRPCSIPEPAEEVSVKHSAPIRQHESLCDDQVAGTDRIADSVTLGNRTKIVDGGNGVKSERRNLNLIGGNVDPLPLKRQKCVNEGNFVRLNLNGYGRKFKYKNRRQQGSQPLGSRRSRWRRCKRKFETEGKAETDGLCDEDGLVSEIPSIQQDRGRFRCSQDLVEQAVLAAREDPSDGNLTKLLKLTHGFESFREGQLEAIKQVVAGKSTMLVLPTGAGKSLCYQLPALILPGLTLVISPLVALMVDQFRQLPRTIPGGLLCSNQTSEENSETVRQLVEGNIKVLFVSPERFLNADFISFIGARPLVSLLVVDEAHCLSEWSHNFRPSYLRLRTSLLRDKLNVGCFLAMTATATSKTLQAIMYALEIPMSNLIQTTQIRENLQLSITLSENRMKDLLTLMSSSPFSEVHSIIIYCKFQFEADSLSKYLCDKNISAKSYHGGMSRKDRNRTQDLFCSNKIRVVVATVAFGMGLDKADVGAVIHYSLPESLEEYVQEIGRAGRDGRLSYCHLFIDESTYHKLRSLSYSDGVDEHAVNKFLSHVFSNDKSSPGKVCSLVKESASRKFDMKEEVMLTILTYLELGEVQYVRLLPQQSVSCTLYFHKTSPDVLASRDAALAEILRSNITQGAYVFDITAVANSAGITAMDLSNQLQILKSKGEITYELKDPALCYVILEDPGDFFSLVKDVTRWLSEVETCKVSKLNAMFNAAFFAAKECDRTDGCSGTLHSRCLQSRILKYFGSNDKDNKDFPNKMGQSSVFLRADIKVFLQSNVHAKFTPRAVARIMHGIASPAYPSSVWSKTHFWGRYIHVDFPIVMEAATAELMNFAGKHLPYE